MKTYMQTANGPIHIKDKIYVQMIWYKGAKRYKHQISTNKLETCEHYHVIDVCERYVDLIIPAPSAYTNSV
jgi:hypothetical protein